MLPRRDRLSNKVVITQLMMPPKKAASWVFDAATCVARCLCLLTREDVRAEILWTTWRFRAPAAVSLLLFLGLWLPDQTRELYVVLAENLFREASVGSVLFFAPVLLVFIACLVLWICSDFIRSVVDIDVPKGEVLKHVQYATQEWVPLVIGLLPLLGLALGMICTMFVLRREQIASPLLWLAVFIIVAVVPGLLFLRTRPLLERRWSPTTTETPIIYLKARIRLGIRLIILILVFYYIGPKYARPIAILCVFSIILSVLLTWLFVLGVRWKVPLTGILVGAALFQSWIGLTDNDRLSMSETKIFRVQGDVATPEDAYRAWLKSVDVNAEPIVIAAQGGGLYAAYHTAMVLARLYDLGDHVGRRVFAVSGVSGGAVGAAVFDAIHRSEICKTEPGKKPKPDCYTDAVRKVLRRDFLSPLLWAMLFPDFAARIIPNFCGMTEYLSRARWLEDAFDDALRDLFPEDDPKREHINSILDTPILTPWKAEGRPLLLLNTTDVNSGERMVITPLTSFVPVLSLPTYANVTGCKMYELCASPDILASSLVSARFPYLTPAAQLTIRYEKNQEREARYVDGGYFENSGVETARDFIHSIREFGARALLGYADLIAMDFPALEESDRSRLSSFEELRVPVRALLATRGARGELAKQRADEASVLDVGFRYRHLRLDNTERAFTLGWALSENTFDRIECNLWNDDACDQLGALQTDEAAADPIYNISQWSPISAWNCCEFHKLTGAEADEFAFCAFSGGGF